MHAKLDGPALVLGAFALVLMGGVFALDALAPPEVAAGALYSIVIFYSWLLRANVVVGTGALCSALAFLELFVHDAGPSDVVAINKLIAVVTIWVSTALVLFAKSSLRHVEEARGRLEAAERLARELELAERIQTSLLPRPPLAPGIEIAARMVPAAEVGGDYYDVIPADDGCWIAIGDVSGHGLDAGVISLMVQSATQAILRSAPDISPAGAITGINATLHENVHTRLVRDDFITFSLLRYRRDGRVTYCGAHEDILVWRAATRTVEQHPTVGTWLALGAKVEVEVRELRLGDGDVMVLWTDGLIENRNDGGEMFGLPAATRLLAERGDEGASEVVEALVQQSLRWSPLPEDDTTVVALRHRERSP